MMQHKSDPSADGGNQASLTKEFQTTVHSFRSSVPIVEDHTQFIEVLTVAGFDREQTGVIDAAYDLAKRGHSEASRDGGGRYFNHCRSVALILIQEGGVRDPDIIAASLLHDTVEDTSLFGSHKIYGVIGVRAIAQTRIASFFNSEVADYVLAVTKIHKTGDSVADAENKVAYFEGLKIAPIGALLIKVADRLHNLRSLASCSADKQLAQFKETTEVLLPLFEMALGRSESKVKELDRLVQLVRIENELLGARL